MRDYLTLGPTPAGEECLPANHDDPKAVRAELVRYRTQLERQFAKEMEETNISFAIKTFPHDFGSYSEVCVIFDDEDEDACKAAYHIEDHIPENWEKTNEAID